MYSLKREYHKKFTSLNNLVPRTENNKELKQEVLINAGDIYNELYYIYKNKYNKKINSLDTENRTKLDYKRLRLSDDYEYLSEEEKEKTQEKRITDANKFDAWTIKKETDINEELFKRYFNFQRPSDIFNFLNNINDKENKNKLVNVINSGLKDLKEEIKEMSEEERKIEEPDKIVEIVKEILRFVK